MADIVDLADRRFERNAAPGLESCLSLIEGLVLEDVADPILAARVIFTGTALYLLSRGAPVELLRQELETAIAAAPP